jgi:hypothetical protein
MVVSFPAGMTEAFINVPTTEDATAELPERFTAILSNPSAGLQLGPDIIANVDITDDDGESKEFKKLCMLSVLRFAILLISPPPSFLSLLVCKTFYILQIWWSSLIPPTTPLLRGIRHPSQPS